MKRMETLIDEEGKVVFERLRTDRKGSFWFCRTFNFTFEVKVEDDPHTMMLYQLAQNYIYPRGCYRWA